ncbi:TRAP transporter small permease [Thalassotalea agarivorans]|uniref:TRAP transporter small permease protein n=1 Tax=Thalassotalea agarivorans TaxID=349064 RepID=A0A1I0GTH3_THASX|nr:TRAP transporter small permease [Thalassotalea agarivorans]SET74475.1 TRAP-type C4-dicarboxylate transport system, small permease component [Thalassotalea agarivorans]
MTTPQTHIEDQSPDEQPFVATDYRIEDWLALTIFTVLSLTVFAQFFSRYVLGGSLGWTEEVARYLLVALTFLGGCMAIRKKTMIQIDFIADRFPQSLKQFSHLFARVFSLLFIGVLIISCALIMPRLTIYQMASLPVSVSALYGAIFIALLIMFYRCLVNLMTSVNSTRTAK